MRTDLLERYRALPLPTKADEHWRFTDLAGFDPDAWSANGATEIAAPATLLDIEAAGVAFVGEGGIRIERAPEGIRFEPLTDDHPLLHSLVGTDEKFAAHNAAMWKHGLLIEVPKGVVLDKPLYVRVANAVEGGSLFWRLLVVADPESRFTVIEEYVSSSPELASYSNAAIEIFVGQAAKVEYVSVQSLSQQTWHFASHHAKVERDAELDWVTGGFGSGKGRSASRTTSQGQGRRRASPAPISRTAPSISTTTRFRSTSPRTRRRTSPSRARSATRRGRSGAA